MKGAYQRFERFTGDIKAPIIEVLEARREELRQLVIAQRNPVELSRLQGRAEELDVLIRALHKDEPR